LLAGFFVTVVRFDSVKLLNRLSCYKLLLLKLKIKVITVIVLDSLFRLPLDNSRLNQGTK